MPGKISIRSIAQFYPLPNARDQSYNPVGRNVASDPSIEGHIDLETRSSRSIEVDHAAGSIEFVAKDRDYLCTEHL